MASIAGANSLFEIEWNSMGYWKRFKNKSSRKVRPQKTWWLGSNNSAKRTAKVGRIGRFVRMMEACEQFCRSEAGRLNDRVSHRGRES
jgi:hypothetical protein